MSYQIAFNRLLTFIMDAQYLAKLRVYRQIQKFKSFMNRDERGNQQNMSFSEQNILANSIRIAREKFGNRVDDQSKVNKNQLTDQDIHNHSFSFSKNKSGNSAAQAIKVLHIRIAQLEAFNATLTKQTSQAKRQTNLKLLQLQSLRSQLAQAKQKTAEYKESLSKIEKALKLKQSFIEQLERALKQKQSDSNKLMVEKQIRLSQSLKIREHLQQKIVELNKRLDNNQKVIVQMIRQLEEQKVKNSRNLNNDFNSPHTATQRQNQRNKHSKSSKSKEMDNFPVIVDEPQGENPLHYKITNSNKQKLNRQSIQTKKLRKQSGQKRVDKNLETLNKELEQKNRQLYQMLRNSDRKFKDQQKMKNQYKERFYSLKNLTDLLVQEINRLPTNLSHKFKCLVVKIKKIENDNLECLRSFSVLQRNRFHSKSSRNSSKQSQNGSKKKQKQLKMEDLNLSDHNMSQGKSHSKSKRKSLANYLKSHSGKKGMKSSIEPNQQTETIKALSRKIREQRKQLCEMYKKVKEERDPQNEMKLKNEFEQKMAKNIELQAELQHFKKLKI